MRAIDADALKHDLHMQDIYCQKAIDNAPTIEIPQTIIAEVKAEISEENLNLHAWHNIFREYVECYKSIQTLSRNGILDDEEKAVHEHNLLFNLVETMKTEIEE